MSRERIGVVWAGLGLIGLGIALLAAQLIGWDKLWPIFPIFAGVAFFAGYISSGFKDAGMAFVGTAALLVGFFFFGFTFGLWQWEAMVQLWPVFPLIGGIAFLVLFLAESRARDLGVLGVGCAAVIVGVVGLAFTYGVVGGEILKYWPLLLVLVGLVSLVGALVRGFRRDQP
jgi:hypothetical protein